MPNYMLHEIRTKQTLPAICRHPQAISACVTRSLQAYRVIWYSVMSRVADWKGSAKLVSTIACLIRMATVYNGLTSSAVR